MKIKKLLWFIMLFLLLNVVNAVKVELLENTDNCISCYSTYKITADTQNLYIGEQNTWFEFRDSTNPTLRHGNQVKGLKKWELFIEDERQVEKNESVIIGQNCSQVLVPVFDEFENEIEGKKELAQICKPIYKTNYWMATEKYYRPFQPFDKTIKKGESILIKISGDVYPNSAVDNVLVLKEGSNWYKYIQWAWWNNTWQNKKAIYFNETNSVNWVHTFFPMNTSCLNITGLTFSDVNELRFLDNDTIELPYQVISNTTDSACVKLYDFNMTIDEVNHPIYVYYNANTSVGAGSYSDYVVVNTTGNDTIDGNGSYGYDNAVLKMDGGAITSFELDGSTQILDETGNVVYRLIIDTALHIFSESETDDLCTQIYDGILESKYICESGEDSNLDGDYDAGETVVIYYFRPDSILVHSIYGLTNDYRIPLISLDESIGDAFYYDNTNTGSGPISTLVVVSNGYLINDMTTSDELIITWNEDASANTDELLLAVDVNSTSIRTRAIIGQVSGDGYRLASSLTDLYINYQTRTAYANTSVFNNQGKYEEERFDTPLNYSFGTEENRTISNYTLNYNTTAYELKNQSFSINMSWDNTTITEINITYLEYNNTNYSAALQSNGSDWKNYETSVITPVINTNNSNIPFKWYYTIYYSNSSIINSSTASNNQALFYSYWISNLVNNGNTTEGSNSIVNMTIGNITISASPSLSYIIEWNGTNYSATNVASNIWQYSTTVPATNTSITINQTGYINISYGGINATRNYSYINQTMLPIGIDNCSNYTTRAINISLRNETDDSLVVGNIEALIVIANVSRNFNLTWSGNSTYGICINPNWAYVTDDSQFEYWATNFSTKNYYMFNTTLDNITDTIDLYLTDSTTQVTFTVTDENDDEVENVYIYIQSYDLGTGSFKTTEIVKTDFLGKAYAQLVLGSQWYKFKLYYNGELKLDTGATKILSTTVNFRIDLEEDILETYDEVMGISCDVSFNNATQNFELSFNNPASTVINAYLYVYKQDIYSQTLVNYSNLSAASGTVLVGIGTQENKTYIGKSEIVIGSQTYICGDPDSVNFGGAWITFGTEGIIMTLFLLIFVVCYFAYSPILAIVGTLVITGLAFIFGIIYLGWAALVSFIILGGIAVYRLSAR